ncbi:chorismate-binding protein [Comamonas flocculans]|uniref:Bifunctional aminodeoxychorismate synthase component I/aminotransferase n=1 Tax=Comamonas flocculans TaxID=2597701 RepID=A0A5B8RWJ0_9BURK|nr:chorismate-binding protein [Comamonas flocculans]QEA13048.1 bifunctional aminodeoxychorismate synthase component I/aminotransferase [Comamonas flocculans]
MTQNFPSARIDFTQPLVPDAPRLRAAFGPPREVLVAHAPGEVRALLRAVDAAARQGRWCVGYLRYEAAAAFDAALTAHAPDGPLAWFAVHDGPQSWPDEAASGDASAPYQIQWANESERAAFDAAIARIHAAIAAGELYQVNHTAPLVGRLQGSPAALFAALHRAQPGGYGAHIDAGDEQVLSVSPELFFDWRDGQHGGEILARPMKGTAARGGTPEEDAAQAAHLRASPKERAENVMIVDLLRNDLSRIATAHGVRVPVLFATQALPTVWQMTSDVRARTRAGLDLVQVFAALFPCGSVTGAPKVSAMRMIRALEPRPRGVYCGAVGVVRPHGAADAQGHYRIAATFNVPIRTVELREPSNGGWAVRCGIGSGITADASAEAEWQEWRHKRAFLARASQPFELLQTLALRGGQWGHAQRHVRRMAEAAAHFGFAWREDALWRALDATAQAHPLGHWRVRLLLDAQGRPRTQAAPLAPTAEPVRLALADRPFLAAHDEFTRHKTTRREPYAAFAPTAPGVFDTVLFNEAGEITEGTFGNLAALIDGRWITPALACGLLPGVGRALAIEQGRVVEAVLRVQDVPRVQAWAFVNSLRGWLAATLD